MRSIAIAVVAVCALAACRAHPGTPGPAPRDRCQASRVQDVIGQLRSSALAERARRRARADSVRYLLPDQIVTMEYRYGRLNLTLDANGRVTRASCG